MAENFSALTRLDHNRAVGQLALKAGADVEDVTGCIIWGNHSSTQYPDINSATIKGELLRRVLAAVVVVWECSWNWWCTRDHCIGTEGPSPSILLCCIGMGWGPCLCKPLAVVMP